MEAVVPLASCKGEHALWFFGSLHFLHLAKYGGSIDLVHKIFTKKPPKVMAGLNKEAGLCLYGSIDDCPDVSMAIATRVFNSCLKVQIR